MKADRIPSPRRLISAWLRFSREDSTTALCFATLFVTLTVITDHDKRPGRSLFKTTAPKKNRRKKKQQPQSTRRIRETRMSAHNPFTRRGLLKTAGGIALVSGISAPAILRA